jgi:hypothetical protein
MDATPQMQTRAENLCPVSLFISPEAPSSPPRPVPHPMTALISNKGAGVNTALLSNGAAMEYGLALLHDVVELLHQPS